MPAPSCDSVLDLRQACVEHVLRHAVVPSRQVTACEALLRASAPRR